MTVVDETAAEADAPGDTEADVEEADTVKTEGMQIILCEYRYCVFSDNPSISSMAEAVSASDSSLGYQAYGVECEIQFTCIQITCMRIIEHWLAQRSMATIHRPVDQNGDSERTFRNFVCSLIKICRSYSRVRYISDNYIVFR